MILRQTIDGREATVSYFDEQFAPVTDLSQPHLAKVLFDDGEVLTLRADGIEPLKVHGQTLDAWERMIAAHDARLIRSALSIGLTAGDDNTDIAHRVIGSRRLNGVDGVTEITRQRIRRLGAAMLKERKSRLG